MVFDPTKDDIEGMDTYFKAKIDDLAAGASLEDVNSEYYTPTELSSASPHGSNAMEGIHINYIEESGPPLPSFGHPPILPVSTVLQCIDEYGSTSSNHNYENRKPIFKGSTGVDVLGKESRRNLPEALGLLVPSNSLPDLPRETKL